MPRTATLPKPRRTQDERSAETRARVLDSAIECLIERGYSGTTTTVIAECAGVSRGAQLHHFPTRQGLVIEAVSHLASRRMSDLRCEAAKLPESDKRLDTVLELLWQSFSGPLFFAATELWVASRTDTELHAALYEVEREIGRSIGSLIDDLGGGTSRIAGFDDLVELTIHMLRGMALQRILRDDDDEQRRQFDLWKRFVIKMAEQGSNS